MELNILLLNIGLLFSVILVGKQFLTIWLGDSFSDNDFNNMHYIFIILTLSYTLTQITDPISKVLKESINTGLLQNQFCKQFI